MDDPPQQVVDRFECELLDVDREILAVLVAERARTTGYLDKATSDQFSRSWVCQRLQRLTDHGPLEQVDHGLYELDTHSQPNATITPNHTNEPE